MKEDIEFLLDELFSDAREQAAQISFEEMSSQLNKSINVNSNLTKKWYSKLFNFKSIIMLSTVIVVGSVLFTLNTNKNEEVVDANKTTTASVELINYESQSAIRVIENDKKQIIKEVVPNHENLDQGFKAADFKTNDNNSKANPNNNFINQQLSDSIKKTKVAKMINDKPIGSIDKISIINSPLQLSHTITETNKDTITNAKLVTYTITEQTTAEELDKIQMQAEAHGIDFNCNSKIKRGNLKYLNIKMSITNIDGRKQSSQYYMKGSTKSKFIYEIQWRIDSNGNVIDFGDNNCVLDSVTTK